MKSMSCRVSGTSGGPGWSSFFLGTQWILAILAPSGKGLPLPGIPDLYASIIAGFPRIAASLSPLWLREITGQFSYPLNSENARPFGTLRVYLSCAETGPCDDAGAAVDAEAARRGRPWMNRASFHVSSVEILDFQAGMPVRRTPFCMIQKSSASLQCCTWDEFRSMAGGFMLRPTSVSPFAAAPWHCAQEPRN